MTGVRMEVQRILASDVAIAAAVGERIYPGRAGQGTELPFIRWRVLRAAPDHSHDGQDSGGKVNLEVSVISMNHDEAVRIAAMVEAALDQYEGGAIDVCLKEDESDQDALVPEGSDNPVTQLVQTFTIHSAAHSAGA